MERVLQQYVGRGVFVYDAEVTVSTPKVREPAVNDILVLSLNRHVRSLCGGRRSRHRARASRLRPMPRTKDILAHIRQPRAPIIALKISLLIPLDAA